MRLLSLDLSSNVGAAWWLSRDAKPKCWTWHLPKVKADDYGGLMHPLWENLDAFLGLQALEGKPVEALAFESPFVPVGPLGNRQVNTQAWVVRRQVSLAAVTELVARVHGIERCVEVTTSQVKSDMLGFARKPHPDFNWKKEIKIAATRMGFSIADDHQADAVGVGRVAYEHLEG